MTNINQVIINIKNAANTLVANLNNNCSGPWDNNFVKSIYLNINELAFEVRNKNPKLYNDLQEIKSNLFVGQNFVNVYNLGRLVQILRSYDYLSTNDFWQFAHPRIIELSKNKFEDGYFSDAVQTALVEICEIIRKYRDDKGLEEIISDKNMIYNSFKENLLKFTDSSTTSLKNIQEGYEKILPGVIQAMRNPNAHSNTRMGKADAARKIMIASDLMFMLDIALKNDIYNSAS